MVGTTFLRLSKMMEDMSETVTPIPDFDGIRDLSTQWRKKVMLFEKFCDNMFGPDRRHLVAQALFGKCTQKMLDPTKPISPIHDLTNEAATPIPEFKDIRSMEEKS